MRHYHPNPSHPSPHMSRSRHQARATSTRFTLADIIHKFDLELCCLPMGEKVAIDKDRGEGWPRGCREGKKEQKGNEKHSGDNAAVRGGQSWTVNSVLLGYA